MQYMIVYIELNERVIDPNKNDDIDVQVLIDIICNISNLNIEEIAEKTGMYKRKGLLMQC